MPIPSTISQELILWPRHWANEKEKPVAVQDTLKHLSCYGLSEKLYPNIVVILRVLLTITATSASVKLTNSALKFVQNVYWSKMRKDRLNSRILMYFTKMSNRTIMTLPIRTQDEIQVGCDKQLIIVTSCCCIEQYQDLRYRLLTYWLFVAVVSLKKIQCWVEEKVATKSGETFRTFKFSIKSAA